ncbi:MAG: hypothetical protein IT167_21465 [Bryobacterales bacterium]|nr:hypothetical protein [Bryobacterales bacterium]
MAPLELLILKSLDTGPNHGFGITLHVQEASGGLPGAEEGFLLNNRERSLPHAGQALIPRMVLTIGRSARRLLRLKETEMSRKGEILKAALEEDPPLTAEQMARRLGFGCHGVLRRRFPA